MFENRSSFFIVGAPRCGTTALSKILAAHPQVCFSRPKESHFFVRDDLPPLDQANLRTQFVEPFFPHLAPEHTTFGEGSVSSLYSPVAIERIRTFDPDARFIIMIRNPVDMVYSYHGRLLFLLDEDQRDFARAWALQDERAAGRALPKSCRDPRLLHYAEVATLAPHVERLFHIAGRDRCYVVVFDDLSSNAGAVYEALRGFLDLEMAPPVRLHQKNQHRTYKSRFLHQFLVNPPPFVIKALEAARVTPTTVRKRTKPLRRWLRSKNTQKEVRPPLSAEMRQELAAFFTPDVARLGQLIGRDLAHWH
ncbi:MAG: sulfotransferase [Rhodospirillales bacterium]